MTTLKPFTAADIMEKAACADLLRVLLECSDELRQHAFEMLDAINDPDADPLDREFAAITLADILHPNTHMGDKQLGIGLAEAEELARDPHNVQAVEAGTVPVLDAMDVEEATFAERLAAIMSELDLTQTVLAERVGLHQSAISMMLARNCRPQRRTVLNLATALGVEPARLWPQSAPSAR